MLFPIFERRKKVKSLGRCNSVGMNALIVTTRGKHGSRVEVEGGGERGHCAGFQRMMIRKADYGEIFKDEEDQGYQQCRLNTVLRH